MTTTKSILLIDDEPDFLDNLSLTLEMAGYKTITAQDGVEALSVLQNQVVDLIISDIKMPHVGGYELYKIVRANPVWSSIPFFLLTGCRFVSDSEVHYGKALGVDEYFTKPIRSKELLFAVGNRLGYSVN